MDQCSVFRDAKGLQQALDKIHELEKRYVDIKIKHRRSTFNYELEEALELGNMLKTAEAIVFSALQREESRGAHFREDFPKRNDEAWLKHTLVFRTPQGLQISYKPVTITKFKPKERKY
jgi:succinate dehydrogenase / fumarate reductase flavoprotein subunit